MGEVNLKILISVKIFCPELPKKVCGINAIRKIRFCFSPYPYYQMGSEGFREDVWLQTTCIICISIALTQAMIQNFLNIQILYIGLYFVWFFKLTNIFYYQIENYKYTPQPFDEYITDLYFLPSENISISVEIFTIFTLSCTLPKQTSNIIIECYFRHIYERNNIFVYF